MQQTYPASQIMDWIGLNDWILDNFPELHEATRYISNMSIQYECWLKVYNNHVKE